VGLVVQAGSPHVCRRGDRDQAFLFGVAVEAGHGAQPAGDCGPGSAERLEVAGEALDVGAARPEHGHSVFGAPGDVLAQVEGVGIAGGTAVAGQEPSQRQLFVGAEPVVAGRDHGACRERNVHCGTSKRDAEAPVSGTGQAAPATNRGRRPYVSPARSLQSRQSVPLAECSNHGASTSKSATLNRRYGAGRQPRPCGSWRHGYISTRKNAVVARAAGRSVQDQVDMRVGRRRLTRTGVRPDGSAQIESESCLQVP
jgi:hypothetical protein